MTPKQKIMLEAIITFIKQHKYSPSVRELCSIIGISSVSTAHGHLERLKSKGFITWEQDRPRTLKVLIEY
ncbi:hypothetical protein GCM10023310_69270 [Paenibacillus vulneris]|uniref:LexA family protein n=1 Tax=Paenibacillus vulneris TaxID=1133364 RepID=A0ABW3UJC9_9BACL